MISDRSGMLIYVNPAWVRTYGYSYEEAVGATPRLVRSEVQNKEFYTEMWRQIGDPNIGFWKGPIVNKTKAGHMITVLLSITPFRTQNQEILGYMGIALDLTEQKRLEAHIAQQDRLATIGELTSGLAHEIGTPIGVIRGRTEMMLMEVAQESILGKNLNIIIKQIDRISGLISSLLKLSRSTNSTLLTELDLNSVFNEVQDLLSYKMDKNAIQFSIFCPTPCLVTADQNRLEQVFINLIMNSIYAIINKPTRGAQNFVKIEVINDGTNSVRIDVIDSGGGIPEKIISKIFDPFFTTKPTDQGTGLGLSIVSRLVHEVNGRIEVSSRPGDGTTFSIYLKKP